MLPLARLGVNAWGFEVQSTVTDDSPSFRVQPFEYQESAP